MSRLSAAPWAADTVWQSHIHALRDWPAGFRVLELCAGAGTAGVALELLLGSGRWQSAGAWDRDPELRHVHAVLNGTLAGVHLGSDGDILAANLSAFPSAHAVIAGPPCPPYSSIGQRQGLQDERARPFVRCIDVIGELASRPAAAGPQLVFFMLENVTGVTFRPRGASASPLDALQDLLRSKLGSGWSLQRVLVNAADFGLPQSRQRVYLVGRRSQCYPRGVPAYPPAFDARLRARVLINQADNSQRADYTDRQAANIKGWKAFYSSSMTNPQRRGQLAFVDISRDVSPRTVWGNAVRREDVCECLTASGPAIHVFALGEGTGQLSLDRPLRAAERAALQGFPAEYGSLPLTETVARRVFGNAMAVPVVGSLLAQEMRCLMRQLGIARVAELLRAQGPDDRQPSRGRYTRTAPLDSPTARILRASSSGAAPAACRQESEPRMPDLPAAELVNQDQPSSPWQMWSATDSEADVAPGLRAAAVRRAVELRHAWEQNRPGRLPRAAVSLGPVDVRAFAARARDAKRHRVAMQANPDTESPGLQEERPVSPESDRQGDIPAAQPDPPGWGSGVAARPVLAPVPAALPLPADDSSDECAPISHLASLP